MDSSVKIGELSLLDDIELVGEDYEEQYGSPPVNISNWDPSRFVIGLDLLEEVPQVQNNGIDYLFSYNQPNNARLRQILGFRSNGADLSRKLLIMPVFYDIVACLLPGFLHPGV